LIRAAGIERAFSASDVIVRTNEPALWFYLIEKGFVNYSIVTEQGREIVLGRLVPGDVFGISALLSDPTPSMGTAKAFGDASALVWDHRLIHQLVTAYPRLAENALTIALRSITLHIQRNIRLVSKTAEQRVAYALAKLGMRAGRLLSSGIEVDINNEDLAALADVNLFTASRLLKKWERKGILTKRRGRVLIRCTERLLAA
jgi:CRP-like cAMP-binding protein